METPRVGLHVEMEGRNGVFVVLRVDTSAAVADILHIGDPSKIETNIPLAGCAWCGEPNR